MKTLKLESVLQAISLIILITMISVVILNISTYGIYNSASFEF